MKHFSTKAFITASTILSATVASLFAEQQSPTVLAIDMDSKAYSIHYNQNGAYKNYLADNVVAVEGAITMPVTAPGAPVVIVAPAYGITHKIDPITDSIIPGRVYENADWTWKEKWGYEDAIDISARYNVAYAITRAGEVVKAVDGADFSSAGVPQFLNNVELQGIYPERIDVDGAGNPWIAASDNNLYRIVDGKFTKMTLMTDPDYPATTLQVSDVGAGAGIIYVVATQAISGGSNRLYAIDAATGNIVYSNWNYRFKAVDVDEMGFVYAVEERTVKSQKVNTPEGVKIITTITEDRLLKGNGNGEFEELIAGFKVKDIGAQ